MKVKLLSFIFVLTFAITSFAARGVGGVSADGPNLTVGILSPQGTHTVVGPAEATGGAVTAFTAIQTQGPGDIANIDVNLGH